jgi:hypothetical protein
VAGRMFAQPNAELAQPLRLGGKAGGQQGALLRQRFRRNRFGEHPESNAVSDGGDRMGRRADERFEESGLSTNQSVFLQPSALPSSSLANGRTGVSRTVVTPRWISYAPKSCPFPSWKPPPRSRVHGFPFTNFGCRSTSGIPEGVRGSNHRRSHSHLRL